MLLLGLSHELPCSLGTLFSPVGLELRALTIARVDPIHQSALGLTSFKVRGHKVTRFVHCFQPQKLVILDLSSHHPLLVVFLALLSPLHRNALIVGLVKGRLCLFEVCDVLRQRLVVLCERSGLRRLDPIMTLSLALLLEKVILPVRDNTTHYYSLPDHFYLI